MPCEIYECVHIRQSHGWSHLHDCDEAEQEHVETQPHIGLELLEQDVAWDLEEDVGHKENHKRDIVLVIFEAELPGKTRDVGIGDVDAVQKCQKVEDAEEGNDMEVNLGHQLALGGVWRTLDVEVIVVAMRHRVCRIRCFWCLNR